MQSQFLTAVGAFVSVELGTIWRFVVLTRSVQVGSVSSAFGCVFTAFVSPSRFGQPSRIDQLIPSHPHRIGHLPILPSLSYQVPARTSVESLLKRHPSPHQSPILGNLSCTLSRPSSLYCFMSWLGLDHFFFKPGSSSGLTPTRS